MNSGRMLQEIRAKYPDRPYTIPSDTHIKCAISALFQAQKSGKQTRPRTEKISPAIRERLRALLVKHNWTLLPSKAVSLLQEDLQKDDPEQLLDNFPEIKILRAAVTQMKTTEKSKQAAKAKRAMIG